MPVPEPRAGDVRIAVYATTVTAAEAAMRQGKPVWGRVILGLFRPRRSMQVQGLEYAGVVDALGDGVTGFAVGDRVFGFTGFRPGACAEYVCASAAGSIAPMPAALTFAQAAAVVDGATTALYFLKELARVRPGQRVAIVGASGSVGGYAVQLARSMGARVTGVCSARNAEFVRELGAQDVIDYTTESVAERRGEYDVIFDAVGRMTFLRARRALSAHGTYTSTAALARNLMWAGVTRLGRGRRVRTGMSVDKRHSLTYITELVDRGELVIPIDTTFLLDQISDAHRLVDSGRKRGNVVVAIRPT